MYKKMEDGSGNQILPNLYSDNGQVLYDEIIRPTYHLFTKANLQNASSLEDLVFNKTFYYNIDSSYIPKMSEDYEKIRSLTVKQSNRFNIIQKLCETFECWVRFVVNYDDKGRIVYGYVSSSDTEVIKGKRYYTLVNVLSTKV